jgi:hypothetical protein
MQSKVESEVNGDEALIGKSYINSCSQNSIEADKNIFY